MESLLCRFGYNRYYPDLITRKSGRESRARYVACHNTTLSGLSDWPSIFLRLPCVVPLSLVSGLDRKRQMPVADSPLSSAEDCYGSPIRPRPTFGVRAGLRPARSGYEAVDLN